MKRELIGYAREEAKPEPVPSNVPCTSYGEVLAVTLTSARARRGVTQAAMAQAVGLSTSAWCRVERAQSPLTCDQLTLASAAIGTTPGALASRADDVAATLRARGVEVTERREAPEDALARGRVPVDREGIVSVAREAGMDL